MNTKIKNINNIFSLIKEKRKELSIQIKELEKDVKSLIASKVWEPRLSIKVQTSSSNYDDKIDELTISLFYSHSLLESSKWSNRNETLVIISGRVWKEKTTDFESIVFEIEKFLETKNKEVESLRAIKREKTGGAEKIKKEIAKLQSQLKELE